MVNIQLTRLGRRHSLVAKNIENCDAYLGFRKEAILEEEYKEEHENTKKYVISRDKKRANYYNYYTTNKWGQLKNFDLTINSDYGLDEAAEIIAEMYKKL